MNATYNNPEEHNGFKVWYREEGNRSYWVARRYPNWAFRSMAGYIIPEEYSRKDKGSLIRFINSKPALKTLNSRKF